MLTKNPQNASAPTSANAALFNYSEQEWREIKAAAQWVWDGPLPKEARENLVRTARLYLAELLEIFPKTQEEERAWQKIADQAETLRQNVSVLVERHLQFLKHAGSKRAEQLNALRWCSDNFINPLCGVRDTANESAERCKVGPPYNNARSTYEFEVLSIWTRLGGELRLSRNPKTQKIQGPLARFFSAVTIPVMGDSAPSLESLPNIVRRQKRIVASS